MGLANLPALIYLVSVPILIYIYYFSRKKRQVEISSIIPWRLLKKSVVTSSLFKADLLFYLQLLGLLILVLAACGPYWRQRSTTETGRRVVIVMDRSASMQTVEGDESRWQLASDRAVRLISRLGAKDRVTLIGAGARPEIITISEGNHLRLEKLIGELGAADTPDNLAPAVEVALSFTEKESDEGETEIYIFTDRSPDSLGFDRGSGAGDIEVVRVGSPKGNRAITSLSIYRNLFSPEREVSTYATVENFSSENFSGLLRVLYRGKHLASKEVELGPGEELTTELGEGLPEGILEIVLEPSDSLEVDNRVYALIEREGTTRVALFTDDPNCRRQFGDLAAAIPNLKIDILKPGQYRATDLEPYRLAIFHRTEPRDQSPADMLVICPQVKSRIVRVLNEWVTDINFLDWDESHPVGENLRGLQNVPLRGCRLLNVPSWASPVVISATTSGDIPLVLCGRQGGRKVAVTSFDISDIELKKSDSMPALLLLLNLLNWLVDEEGDQIKTGESYEAIVPVDKQDIKKARPPDASDRVTDETRLYTVINPKGLQEKVAVGPDGVLAFADTDYVGRYLIGGRVIEKAFVSNLCDSAESDLLSEKGGDEDGITVKELVSVNVSQRTGTDRTNIFLALILALLLLEWFLYVAQRRGWLKTVKG